MISIRVGKPQHIRRPQVLPAQKPPYGSGFLFSAVKKHRMLPLPDQNAQRLSHVRTVNDQITGSIRRQLRQRVPDLRPASRRQLPVKQIQK